MSPDRHGMKARFPFPTRLPLFFFLLLKKVSKLNSLMVPLDSISEFQVLRVNRNVIASFSASQKYVLTIYIWHNVGLNESLSDIGRTSIVGISVIWKFWSWCPHFVCSFTVRSLWIWSHQSQLVKPIEWEHHLPQKAGSLHRTQEPLSWLWSRLC